MGKRTYKAVLFAPDGERVEDCRDSPSIEAVWERVNNQGSRWFFYPFPVVVVDKGESYAAHSRIVSAPDTYKQFERRPLRAFATFLHDHPEWSEAMLS